jgi:hypothetical protein
MIFDAFYGRALLYGPGILLLRWQAGQFTRLRRGLIAAYNFLGEQFIK